MSPSAIWLFIWTTVVITVSFTYGASNCPTKCKCNATTIRCTDKLLNSIPDFKKIVFNPTTIDLSENDIEEVKALNFYTKKLEKLQTLFLNDNSIFSIEETAFSAMANLGYLDISNNLLEEFPSEAIGKNTRLVEINLSRNFFNSKTPKLFSKSLEILNLSFSKLSTFTEDNLKRLPNLRMLNLKANSLHHVSYNIFVDTNLKYVELSYNSWKCNCDTVKLFDFLSKTKLTRIDTTVQCRDRKGWYEDIYDSNGPILHDRFCKKKLHHAQPINNLNNSDVQMDTAINETQEEIHNLSTILEVEILIVVGIVVALIILSLISLTIFVRRTKVSKNRIYKELQTISIDSRLSDGISVQK